MFYFMPRNNFHSIKGVGKGGFVCKQRLFTKRTKLHQKLCCHKTRSNWNTDKVAILYRSFLNHPKRNKLGRFSYDLHKNHLTVILSEYTDARKAPLTIIGTAKRPRSILRHVNYARHVGVVSKSQRKGGTHSFFKFIAHWIRYLK